VKNLKKVVAFVFFSLFLAMSGCGGGGGDDVIQPFWSDGGIAVADLNGDGLSDVVLAKTYISGPPPHPGSVDVILQNTNHTFAAPTNYPVGSDPWRLAIGDVNGDGKLDIAVANSKSGNISILLQHSSLNGAFLAATNVATGGTPYGVAIGDINVDGYADLAVSLNMTGGGVMVLLQSTSSPLTFLSPISLTTGSGSGSVAIGDLNHDDRPDIVMTSFGVVVFYQTSTSGNFGSPIPLTAGNRPVYIAISDINSDGYNDLVVSNVGSSIDGSGASVSVLKQDSNNPGTFLTSVNYAVADEAWDLAIGKLTTGTGPDIAVISNVLQNVYNPISIITTLMNQGSGNYAPMQVINGSPLAMFIAVGDINGDGLTDIVVNDGPKVLLQNSASPGSFNPAIALP